MSLLLQLNGDLPEHFPNDERRLYIFTCRRKACTRKSGSVRALREVRKTRADKPARDQKAKGKTTQQSQTQPPQEDLGAALFGASPKSPPPSASSNPFSMSRTNDGASSLNPFASLPPTSTLAANPPQAPEAPVASSQPANPFASLPPTSTLAAIPPQAPQDSQSDLQETFASKLRVSESSPNPSSSNPSPCEPWPSQSSFPTHYPQLHLDADIETLTPTTDPSQAPNSSSSNSKIQYEDESSTSTNTKDAFESDLDKQFLKFSSRLAQNPEQVLRYEFKGAPLLYSSSDAVASRFPSLFHPANPEQNKKITTTASSSSSTTTGNKIPRCESCGANRVFELQLVPGLIAALEEDVGIDDLEEEGMEWGTIVLGVCERNCSTGKVGEVGWREEWVGVQWEERIVRK